MGGQQAPPRRRRPPPPARRQPRTAAGGRASPALAPRSARRRAAVARRRPPWLGAGRAWGAPRPLLLMLLVRLLLPAGPPAAAAPRPPPRYSSVAARPCVFAAAALPLAMAQRPCEACHDLLPYIAPPVDAEAPLSMSPIGDSLSVSSYAWRCPALRTLDHCASRTAAEKAQTTLKRSLVLSKYRDNYNMG